MNIATLEKIKTKYGFSVATPGFSCLVMRDDEILAEMNTGFEKQGGRLIDTESRFRLASVTKQFTAVAILQLIAARKLAFDTRLSDIYPKFPAYAKNITIHQLLVHSSGLKDYESDLDQITTPQISDVQVLDIAQRQRETIFPPGTQYAYSNGAYCILGQIIEKISGESFSAYLQDIRTG